MWFLEHESLFGGKRVWLRPGSQQLFGRTKSADQDGPQGKNWKIDNKAVSRKHVMLKVYDVAPEDGTKLHKRSQVEVTDLSCRQGTTIDDKNTLKSQKADDGSINYSSEILKGTEHTIRLAQGYAPFKVVWRPMVFTYASKESRDSKARSTQLHALDIKTTADFVFDKTTHVVSAKRNLPKVLSGLTSGKHIITTEFLDAVLQVAATSVDEAQNYVPSSLEEDFDTWWPSEKDYIPAAGAEPVARPQEMLLPDLSRSEVFSGLTFVFLNEGQHSSLLDPVTGGGGKALLYDIRPGETTVEEYVDYVHSVAGKKRRGKTGEKLPVITVRLPAYPDAMEAWAANFVTGADQALGQRSVLQNEFLDVIITKDRASLQRPPAEMIDVPSSAPTSQSIVTRRSKRAPTPVSRSGTPLEVREESAPPTEEQTKTIPRKRVHRAKTSRFTGFDDDEPIPKKRPKIESTQAEAVSQAPPRPTPSITASQARIDPGTQEQAAAPQSHVQDTIEKEEQMDTLFPTAAKIRKQRAATRAPSVSVEPEADVHVQKSSTKGADALARLNKAKAKAEKDINIREHTRQRIKDEEDRRKADEESLREALEGIDITELKNLAKVEEMDVLPRQNRGTTRNQSQTNNERWDPDWNGRKNFKKFRRRGAEQGVQAHKVIVTLEEAPPKKGFGIGDAFFLEDVEPSLRSHGSHRSRKEVDDSSEPEVGGFTRRKRNTQSRSHQEVINVEDSGPDDEEVPEERTQKSSGRTQRVVETQLEGTQTQRGKKRGSGATSGPPAKKGRYGRRDDDSDDEETGFRFKRRT